MIVTVTVRYDRGGYTTDILYVAIFDADAVTYATAFAIGYASSSPDVCSPTSEKIADCTISPASNSGTESVTFHLSLDQVRTWHLDIATGIQSTYSPYDVVSGSDSYQRLTVSVTDKVSLTVLAPYTIPLTVDGVLQSPGSVYLDVYPGTHTISAPQTVNVNAGERLNFDHWSDGSTGATETVNLQDDASYSVVYVTQYKLTLVTSQGVASGDEWVDEGSTARFHVPPAVPMTGILGILGGKFDFQGWYEGKTLETSNSNGSIIMNTSHTLTANWTPNYIIPIAILSVVVIVAVGLTYYVTRQRSASPKRRRMRRKKPDSDTEAVPDTEKSTIQPTTVEAEAPKNAPSISKRSKTLMFCTQCGAKITRDSKFCKECGAKLS